MQQQVASFDICEPPQKQEHLFSPKRGMPNEKLFPKGRRITRRLPNPEWSDCLPAKSHCEHLRGLKSLFFTEEKYSGCILQCPVH
jgi:hypothetical protein